MAGSDENNPGMIQPANVQGGLLVGGGKNMTGTGQNRRALSAINQNILGVNPYPCAVNKKDLSKNNAFCNKDPPIPIHRPITRKFAAQMTNNKHQVLPLEENKKPVKLVPTPNEEDNSTNNEIPVPMFVQHTEAMLAEIDKMEEIEMEDVVAEQPVVNIDIFDRKNHLAVTEYIEDMYAYYMKSEISACVPPNYMAQQSDVNEKMRSILIDWLIEVHYKFELMDETLYLTINLIDRFLAIKPIVRKKLQLVGVTAMLIACKYEEVTVPVVEDFVVITDKAYTRKEVLEMEKLMINTLQFNLSIPTPYVFMRRFLKAAQSNKQLELLSFFIIELCLVEYEMLKFPPSLLAAAAIFAAQCTLKGSKQWSRTSEWHTSYSMEQLLECSRLMVTFHQKAGTGKLTGVYRKYCISKYGNAARSEPANFLLEARDL